MSHWPWRSLALTAAGVIIVTVMLMPDPTPQDYSSLSTAELVDRLGSPRNVVRQAAAGQLIVRGKTVTPDLIRMARTAAPDQLREIVAILEELMLGSDERVAQLAEEGLEELVSSGPQRVSELSQRTLLRNAALRHNRALAHLNRLGATVLVPEGTLRTDTRDTESIRAGPRNYLARVVVLDREWQGGDAGLKHIARLYPGDPLMVHVTEDAPVSEEGLQKLRTVRPETFIRRPHEGCLGISYSRDESVLVVTGIVPNSPADQAGLRVGDILQSLDGEPLGHVRQMATLARSRRPGDLVRLVVIRSHSSPVQTLTLELRLGSDFGTGVCACVE